MFKGMHPIFWIGLAIMYGAALLAWAWETSLPGPVYAVKIAGAASPFAYCGFFMLFVLNVFLAWLWYYVPERDEKKRDALARSQIKKGGGGCAL